MADQNDASSSASHDEISSCIDNDNEETKKQNLAAMHAFVSLKDYIDNPKLGFAETEVRETKPLNILLVGRSQSGKSTVMGTLINPQQAVMGRGYATTKDPEVRAFVLTDEKTGLSYAINMLDTPGLSERNLVMSQTRKDEEIKKLALRCISKEITFLNAIVYVSKGGMTQDLDLEVFKTVREFLGDDFSANSLLLLTHCEEMPRPRIDKIIEDLNLFAPTKELIDYCKLGVLPYGVINADTLDLFDEGDCSIAEIEKSKKDAVFRGLTRIQPMRRKLLEVLFSTANKPCEVSALRAIQNDTEATMQEIIKAQLNKKMAAWETEKHDSAAEVEMLKQLHEAELQKYKMEQERKMKEALRKYREEVQKDMEKQQNEREKQLEEKQRKLREQSEQQATKLSEKERSELAKQLETKLRLETLKQQREFKELMSEQLKALEHRFLETQQNQLDEELIRRRATQEYAIQRARAERSTGRRECLVM